MELKGNHKKQAETAETKAEKQSFIENTGMELTDDELNQVAGGRVPLSSDYRVWGSDVDEDLIKEAIKNAEASAVELI